MDDLLARLAERLSDLGVTAGLGSAVPAGPGVQKTTVRLTRGTSARAYRLLYGQAVSLPDAGLARGAEPPTLVFTSFMTSSSALPWCFQGRLRPGGDIAVRRVLPSR